MATHYMVCRVEVTKEDMIHTGIDWNNTFLSQKRDKARSASTVSDILPPLLPQGEDLHTLFLLSK